MDVSFVIPARNEQNTLKHTVASLYNTVGSSCSFEVIVVDDDSDGELSAHLDRPEQVVYLRNTQRLGVAKSRNIGAREASGDLLVFLDAHVCFAPGWLERIHREKDLLANGLLAPGVLTVRDPVLFVTLSAGLRTPWQVRLALRGRRMVYGHSMTPLPTPQTVANLVKRSNDPFTVPIAGGAALFVKRELFFRLGCFEDELAGFGDCEDAELCMRCWSFGSWVFVVPSIHCFHLKERHDPRIDYRARPFHSARYDQSVENRLRTFYLHLPDEEFQRLVDVHRSHPGFQPDLDAVLTPQLSQRKEFISERRIHDSRWLLRRLSRV